MDVTYVKPEIGDLFVDISRVEEFENCNWHDAAQAVVGGAVAGCIVSSETGCVEGAALGALAGAAAYTLTCWW